jgi:hypothetical protein
LAATTMVYTLVSTAGTAGGMDTPAQASTPGRARDGGDVVARGLPQVLQALALVGIAALALVEARRTWAAESLEDTCCA